MQIKTSQGVSATWNLFNKYFKSVKTTRDVCGTNTLQLELLIIKHCNVQPSAGWAMNEDKPLITP